MAKHNLEVEPEEGYELVQVIAEDRGKKKKTKNKTLLLKLFMVPLGSTPKTEII